MRPRCLLALVAALGAASLATPGPGLSGPGLVVGAVEDHVRASSVVEAEARMQLFRVAGFRAVRVTSYWLPGNARPDASELATLRSVAEAGSRNGVRVFVTVMNPGSRTTPLSDETREQFASYTATIAREVPAIRDVIVGNEPNLNRFWLPQFAEDGSSASPAAYLELLTRTYDALKAVSRDVIVYGGAVSPRGTDRPNGMRPTHSPTTFIQGLGAAYRASGRALPVMDAFAIHVYSDNSSIPPTFAHPKNTTIGIADYEKLVALLGAAFDGTAQPGSTLPVFYAEFGVESQIPPHMAHLYTGTEIPATKPVPEETQAAYYDQALALSFCQPNVAGILLLHERDERDLNRWQSGTRYVDGSPKASFEPVRAAVDRTIGGSIARCPDLELVVRPTLLRFATRSAARRGIFRATFRCNLDCVYRVRLENAATHATRLGRRGRATVGELVQVDLGTRRLPKGTYRYTLRLIHPVNPAPPTIHTGPRFRLP